MDDRLLRDLEILTDLIGRGGWQEVRVQSPDISLLLSADVDVPGLGEVGLRRVSPDLRNSAAPAKPVRSIQAVASAPAQTPVDPSWTVVEAPNLGTFYRSPKPGAPAFVEVGQKVDAGTELCLIEVMKLFTSVRAKVVGTIRHIAAADAELVEGGQPLIYIEPE